MALHIRAQNAAVIIRRRSNTTVFEAFEVQAPTVDVMATPGKLVQSYPGPVVELPNSIANDPDFTLEMSSILTQMDTETLEGARPTTVKAGSEVDEDRESANPNYFIQLLFGILRGMGEDANPERIVKRTADEVLWKDAARPWRRSSIWLIIRVAVQTSLDSKLAYKHFMAFFHAGILFKCLDCSAFSSDLLFAMRVKMARRLFKLKDSAPEHVIETCGLSAEATQAVLQKRWDQVQAELAQPPEWNPGIFDFDSVTNQTLPNSRKYLEKVFRRRVTSSPLSSFTPKQRPRLQSVDDFVRYADENLANAFFYDQHIALFDFEDSVFTHLTGWTERNSDPSKAAKACRIILSCFQQYLSLAGSYYTVDAADQSIMILTIMRLWMAIDQLATAGCPLLLDFSPEIPEELLEALLLQTSIHIESAGIVQRHIRSRHKRALPSNHSIFSDEASPHCFAVQYFQGSSRLQSLKSRIERNAQLERHEKVKELESKNEEYSRLDKQARQMPHKYFTNRWGKRIHDRFCERCSIEAARDIMEIQLHEWPLPHRQYDAELVVFELERPEVFTIWRDTTYGVLRDLGSSYMSDDNNCNVYITLERYSGLSRWLSSPANITPRIILASPTKPFTSAHYSSTRLQAREERVCVRNGLKFQLYDKDNDTWASGPFDDASFAGFGTFELSTSSCYQHLSYTLEGTSHSVNQVISEQSACPKELSLHEHIAFGSLRSGSLLQWMNILRGLEEDILTFSSEEVKLLHTQAAWQIGPLSEDESRECHQELEDSNFRKLLIDQSRRLLAKVQANWLEATSLSTVGESFSNPNSQSCVYASMILQVLLVLRLLASVDARDDTVGYAYSVLREARQITLKWLNELQIKLQNAEIDSDILEYQNRICEMAAICRSTFDVDSRHLHALLKTPEDFGEFIKSFVVLYDNQPSDPSNAPTNLQMYLCRDQRLSHKTSLHMLQSLQHNNRILCAPISSIWPHYRAGPNGWQPVCTSDHRWVSTTTAVGGKNTSQKVHLNLLDGQLLIDGKPLGRLPRDYVQHPTYIRLFGQVRPVQPQNGIHNHILT